MTTASKPLPKCPNCNSIVPPGKPRCISCGMEVSKMEDYRRAAAAAAAKLGGKVPTMLADEDPAEDHNEKKPQPAWVKPAKIGGGLAAAALVLLVAIFYGGKALAKPEPWKAFPTDPKEAVTTYIKLIADDSSKAAHQKAYALISPRAKNPERENEADHFLQYHHDIYKYLWGLTRDPDWISAAKTAPDPKESDVYTVTVGPEVFHIQVVDEAPKEAQDRGQHHFSVMPIREIDPFSIARMNASAQEGTLGMARAVGAGGIERTLRGMGALSEQRHETAMDRKMRVLPLLNSPDAPDLDRHIIRLWKYRTDPAVRWKLEEVTTDERYAQTTRDRAKRVLDGSLDLDTEGAALGVEP